MKTNLFLLTITNVLTFSIFAGSVYGTNTNTPATPLPISKSENTVTSQIQKFIQINNINVANLKTGIVIVSFSVDENNELLDVVSHSKILSLDRYLQSCLEGKTLVTIKIRFAID